MIVPGQIHLRKQWEVALRREGFSANDASRLCHEHFRQEDFDRTGQTVRIRDGALPSVFRFPTHLQRPMATRTTLTSVRAQENLSVDCSLPVQETEALPDPSVDHSYALPTSLENLRTRLNEIFSRVESMEREKRKAKDRERRAKNRVCGLLQNLREKNLIIEGLKERLDLYSALPVHLLSKQSHEYTKDQKEIALSLHLHGPKAYNYLRESLHLNFPHPHTLQSSFRCQPWTQHDEDPAKYRRVSLLLDAMTIKKHVQYDPHT
ncbi:THAP domain-containing protein 6-like [Paramormyrops kingsleyae]|uniref:THAP domain-containing protein 6-like n=1 Tax=Paramormyrops kingsleyae TaxID=1676925 RepID=UPI003B978990